MDAMDVFLHTICVEPARWTPQRVSRPLVPLFPACAEAGFRRLEIFEPHLRERADWPGIREGLQAAGLEAAILSSYVDLVHEDEAAWESSRTALAGAVADFGFRAIRLFPGSRCRPDDTAARETFTTRLGQLAATLPGTGLWLETHDGSFADDPEVLTDLVRDFGHPDVGLIFQPTRFTAAEALRQYARQKPFIRHFHLQNRHPDLSFAPLADGVVVWAEILGDAPEGATASIEFVPAGICSVEEFDLSKTLAEAMTESACAVSWANRS
jgi:sugar phosphate isomerase/epimerase